MFTVTQIHNALAEVEAAKVATRDQNSFVAYVGTRTNKVASQFWPASSSLLGNLATAFSTAKTGLDKTNELLMKGEMVAGLLGVNPESIATMRQARDTVNAAAASTTIAGNLITSAKDMINASKPAILHALPLAIAQQAAAPASAPASILAVSTPMLGK